MTPRTLRSHLADELTRSHNRGAWHGPARSELLTGISAPDAHAHPVPGAHSIWELVLHMTAWTREVSRRLHGAAPAEPLEGDWPKVASPTDANWTAALVDLDSAHAALLATVASLPVERLDDIVGSADDPALGTGTTCAMMIAGIAEHDAYHCGQIALLLRALGR